MNFTSRIGRVITAAMATFVFASPALGADVDKIRTYRDGEAFITEMAMAGAWVPSDNIQARFSGSIIEVQLPQTTLPKGKHIIRPDDRLVRSVLIAPAEGGSVRAKIYLKDGNIAKSMEGVVHVRKLADNLVTIEVTGDAEKGPIAKNEAETVATLAVLTGESADAGIVGTPKLVVDGSAAVAASKASAEAGALGSESQALTKEAAPEKKIDTSKLSENEIPVLTTAKTEKKAEGGTIERLMITLGVLAVALGGATFGIKRWAAKSGQKNQNTKIKVLTQHMLGPKKSLAIVQVAGEAILIGVTDQNISMLKTLSLLDEEIPEEVPRNFGRTLADFDEEDAAPAPRAKKTRARQVDDMDPNEDFAMRGLSEIRDVVSTRLKGLKNL